MTVCGKKLPIKVYRLIRVKCLGSFIIKIRVCETKTYLGKYNLNYLFQDREKEMCLLSSNFWTELDVDTVH